MDTRAEDLSELVEVLDLRDAIHVGYSTGACELVRYIGRVDAKRAIGRAARIVLIGAVPPLMLKTPSNTAGIPMETLDEFRRDVMADRSQFFKNLAVLYYGANRPGSSISQGVMDWFWLQAMQAGFKAVLDSIKAFGETDFTEDLKDRRPYAYHPWGRRPGCSNRGYRSALSRANPQLGTQSL
jgi:non-heme chloroperoxidase